MPKYIDIHAHINFEIFKDDNDEIIRQALDNDTWVINVGTQLTTSRKAVEMTNKYKEGVYSTIGLHPIHTGASYHDKDELGDEGKEFTSRGEIFDKNKYKELIKLGKVVGIGECGLDYYRCTLESIDKQKTAFIEQIKLADELNLPLMLHIRNNSKDLPTGQAGKSHNAYFDVCELLKEYSKSKDQLSKTGVVHFFAGSVEDMKRFINLGFFISFAGPITFPIRIEICDYEEVIRQTPLEMIMADTDSPYVAPVPYRGRQNKPIYVAKIVEKIAQIKELPKEEMAEIIVSNGKRLFDI